MKFVTFVKRYDIFVMNVGLDLMPPSLFSKLSIILQKRTMNTISYQLYFI